MRIGIDFDNTIITYDEVFRAAAQARGLIEKDFGGSKQAVRDAIRLLPDGELAWQRLQGQVYGTGHRRRQPCSTASIASCAAAARRARWSSSSATRPSSATTIPTRVNLRRRRSTG